MKIRNIYYVITGLLLVLTTACQDDVNDWAVDGSHDRLFRSTSFECVEENPTSALLSFNGVQGATKYYFEFSKGDSLLFNNIVFTANVYADTLSAYDKGTLEVNTEYRVLFDGLDGTSRYSVRMKALNEQNGMESGYTQLCFDTPDEQIFTNVTPGTTSVVLNWSTKEVATRIEFAELTRRMPENETEEEKMDTLWYDEPFVLTEEQKLTGELTINDLKPGTNYLAYIFNEDARRGAYAFRTLGSSQGETILVPAGGDINALLAGKTGDVTLSFEGGKDYSVGEFTVPEGVSNLYISGNVVGGKLPRLTMSKFVFSGLLNSFQVQYMDVVSDESAQFLVELNNANGAVKIGFDGCYISQIPRSLVRTNTGDLNIEEIKINNCIIKNVGLSGYGLLNIGKLGSLGKILITKNTLLNIGDQIIDLRVQVDEFTFTQSTFCNYTIGMPKLLRLDKQPKQTTVTQNIFTGNNNGSKMNSSNNDKDANFLSFAGCYLTSEFPQDKRVFTDAQVLTVSGEDLFVDPRNGDFHFKPGVKFEGDGEAGDPRWWTK
ncbi:DUF5123 domain-containing protein [Bacteroides fluxus]|nr:DUF5123 domain-containing protein [Bacteroides fluxus]MDY3789772.1 DUF5123 domain-containing protein [Bacteroides fluxus]